jgi:hypothetical protein
MKDLYYSSNQQKYKLFLEENRLREINQEEQQQVIDNELAQKYGLEQQATNIGNLTNRVINKLLTKDVPPLKQTFTPILSDSINNGYLSDLFSFMKTIKAKTEAEQNVINNLKNKKILDKINTENEKAYFKNLYKDMDKTHTETSQKLLDDILKNVINQLTNNKNEVEALNNIIAEADIQRRHSTGSSNATTEQGSLSEFTQNSRSDKNISRGRYQPTFKKLEEIRGQLKRSGISDRSLSIKNNTPY